MELVGIFAGACVLATFCMQSMLALRTFAIASNVLFIIYAARTNLLPILLLHIILLPINGWSLGTIIGGRRTAFALCLAAACFAVILITFGLPYARSPAMRTAPANISPALIIQIAELHGQTVACRKIASLLPTATVQ